MKKQRNHYTLFAALLSSASLQSSADLLVHEEFGDSGLGNSSGTGFVADSAWEFTQGNGVSDFDPLGLSYADTLGNRLVSSGGALQITPGPGESKYTRPLENPIAPGGRADYWVSYLIRLDSPAAGEAFWSPDGAWDIGGFGFQGNGAIKFVNGSVSDVTVLQGETALVIMNLKSDTSADLWINPADLTMPGPANIIDGVLPDGNTVQGANTILFKLNNSNSGSYTIDEFRYGESFEDVAPSISGDDPSILVQDEINPTLGQDPVSFDVLVRNQGTTQDLLVNSATLSGPQAGLFTVTSAFPLTVAPGASANLQLTFTPAGHIGPVSATAELASNASLTPMTTTTISGIVSDPAIETLSELVFDPTSDSSPTVTKTLTITNGGRTQALDITEIMISGEDAGSFALTTTLPLTVPPSATQELTFNLDPSVSLGTLSAIATIASNDLGSPSIVVDLSGIINQSNPAPFASDDFSDPGFTGTTGTGFVDGAGWFSDAISFTHQAEGLVYTDASGNTLSSSGGSIAIPNGEGGTVRRNLATPIPAGGNADYWISYLIRVDGDLATTGDAFWSPDGAFDIAAVGFQGSDTSNQIRIVNGATTGTMVNGGETALIVANLKSDSSIDIWVNPDLANPGPPTLLDGAIGNQIREANDIVFKFNTEGTAGYSIDEFRYGLNFATVAPIGSASSGGSQLAISSFEINEMGNIILTWNSIPLQAYAIEQSPTLIDGTWIEIQDPQGADNATETTLDLGPPAAGAPKMFYRVAIPQ